MFLIHAISFNLLRTCHLLTSLMPSSCMERDDELSIPFHTLHDTDVLVISHTEAVLYLLLSLSFLGTPSTSMIAFEDGRLRLHNE